MSQKPMVQKRWSLFDHGILWKQVVKAAADQNSFRVFAEEFVKQFQEAKKPKDALEGMLLDRMASSYLRKVMLLGEHAEYKDYVRDRARVGPGGNANSMLLATTPTSLFFNGGFDPVMRYESLLDRGFHRDLFLLLQLQALSEQSTASSSKKPTAVKTIEGVTKEPGERVNGNGNGNGNG